jgi:hypothetical protein
MIGGLDGLVEIPDQINMADLNCNAEVNVGMKGNQ